MVNGCYKKQALASKDVGPAEIGRAVRGLGTRRIDLAVAACEPLPSPSPDITEALATLTPPPPQVRRTPPTQHPGKRNHTPFSCEDRVTGFSNSIYSAIEKLNNSWDCNGTSIKKGKVPNG